MSSASAIDTTRLTLHSRPAAPAEGSVPPAEGRPSAAQDTVSAAPTRDATFDRFAAKFAAEVFVASDRPIAYIAKERSHENAPNGEPNFLENNNFWANLDDKLAHQMCNAGESCTPKKRDHGSCALSESIKFRGKVKMQREDDEVTLCDPRGHTVKLLQLPQDAANTLLQTLHYVPLPNVRQLVYMHQLPDERYFAVTQNSYVWDYEAFLGETGAMVPQRVVDFETFLDGGTTFMTTDAGVFYSPSPFYKDRVATFCFEGTQTALPLRTFGHEESLVIAKSLGVINDDSALPVLPDLSSNPSDAPSA